MLLHGWEWDETGRDGTEWDETRRDETPDLDDATRLYFSSTGFLHTGKCLF